MKLLRFRYILPASLLIIFDMILIAYAAIMWDSDPSNIWHGPNMPDPYKDNIASWSSDGNWDDSYTCPVIPPKEPPPGGDGDGDGDGGPGGDGDGPPPPPPPPPVVAPVTDPF